MLVGDCILSECFLKFQRNCIIIIFLTPPRGGGVECHFFLSSVSKPMLNVFEKSHSFLLVELKYETPYPIWIKFGLLSRVLNRD